MAQALFNLPIWGSFGGANPQDFKPRDQYPGPSGPMALSAKNLLNPETVAEIARQTAAQTPPTQETITAAAAQPAPPPGAIPGTNPEVQGGSREKMDPNEAAIRSILDQLGTKGLESVNNQRKTVSEQEQMLKAYLGAMKPQTDLTSIAALVDTWYGGNAAKSLPKAIGGQDIASTATGLQGAVQKARTGLGEADMQLLKDQLTSRLKLKELDDSQIDKALKREQLRSLRDQGKDRKEQRDLVQDREKWEKNTGTKLDALTTFNNNLNDFESILKKHNGPPPIGSADWLTLAQKYQNMTLPWKTTGELGAISGPDADIIRGALGPQTLMDWVKQNMVAGGAEGVFRNIADMKAGNQKTYERVEKTGSSIYPESHVSDLVKQRRSFFNQNTASGMSQSTTSGKSYDDMDEEEIRAAHAKQFGAH